MRYLIHEQHYERPLLAGRLRYERDGRPTGAVESWRLTATVDGYRFLRVDLDARESSGRSWLYHLTLNPGGQPEQIKCRLWADGLEVASVIVWQDSELLASRLVNDQRYEDVARGAAFWFPSGAGLALLLRHVGATEGVTLRSETDDPARALALVEMPLTIALGDVAMMTFAKEQVATRPLSVCWADNRRMIWLDDDGRPLRLWRDDGLAATAERLVRY